MFGQRRSASADAAWWREVRRVMATTPKGARFLALRLGRRTKAWAQKRAEAKKQ